MKRKLEAPADGTVLDIAVSEDEGSAAWYCICYNRKPNEKVEMQESTHVIEEKNI